MMNIFYALLQFRKWILYISKVLCICLCIYYMVKASDYQVSWSLLTWAMPTYMQTINSILSSVGTYILLIPLTIIIASILIPESHALHITSCLFGITNMLWILIKGLKNNTLGEVTNFKFFTVAHTIKLQEKRDIFIAEYKSMALESYMNMIKVYNYLIEKLESEYFITYDTQLHNLQLSAQIKQYAADVVAANATQYANIINSDPTPSYTKYIILGVASVILFFGACVIINHLVNSGDAVEHTTRHLEATKDLAVTGGESAALSSESITTAQQAINEILKLTTTVLALNVTTDSLTHKYAALETMVKDLVKP